jgi:hypothetical protein
MADDATVAAALAEIEKAHASMRALVLPYWSWIPTGIAQQIDTIFAQLTDAETKLKGGP